jgi:hypothetical protein
MFRKKHQTVGRKQAVRDKNKFIELEKADKIATYQALQTA